MYLFFINLVLALPVVSSNRCTQVSIGSGDEDNIIAPPRPMVSFYMGKPVDLNVQFGPDSFPEARRIRVGGDKELVKRSKGLVDLFASGRPKILGKADFSTGVDDSDGLVSVIMIGENEIRELQQHPNLKTIVSVSEFPYHPEALKRLEAIGIKVTSVPTRDFGTPTMDQFKMVSRAIEDSITAGHDVLLHCGAGKERSSMYTRAYEMYRIMQESPLPFNSEDHISSFLRDRNKRHYGQRIEFQYMVNSIEEYAINLYKQKQQP